MAKVSSLAVSDTGNLTLPSGTSAQRPTITTTVVSFTATGNSTWTCPAGVTSVEVLVVAGGGGGGGYISGGGGAGGVVYNSAYPVTPGTVYSLTVGAGGAGGTGNGKGTSGGNSTFDTITAIGGGGGGGGENSVSGGLQGGSGGGGGRAGGGLVWGNNMVPASGTPGQGHAGGIGGYWGGGDNWGCGAGGGGAGGPGQDAYNGRPGNGGPGVAYAITGSLTYYAGGGGGGVYNFTGAVGSKGGVGGGGNGSDGTSGSVAAAGSTNTGGGGGAGGYPSNNTGGAGGSGIVVLKYALTTDTTNPQGATRINSSNGAYPLEAYVSTAWKTRIKEPIVTNGLAMHLDGSTYVSGSTWYDISGNGNDITLTGSPTYNTDNGGYLQFDGSTQYGALTNTITHNTQWTVNIWFKPSTITNYQNPIDCNYLYNGTGTNSNIGPRLETNSAGKLGWIYGDNSTTSNSNYTGYISTGDTGATTYWSPTGTSTTMSAYQTNLWYCATLTRDASGIVRSYLNGICAQTGYAPLADPHPYTNTSTFVNLNIGRGFYLGGTGRYFNGGIGIVQVYTRPLSDKEVADNYNALCSRYNRPPITDSYQASSGNYQRPNIVTGSLQLYLDAADPASYPGYGPYWYDLSGNYVATSSNATTSTGVRAGPTWTPDCGGSFYFSNTGSACYFDLNSSTIISGTSPFTIDIWYNNPSGAAGELLGNYGPSYTSNTLWIFPGGLWINGGVGYVPSYASKMTGKHHLVCTRDNSGLINVWLDGYREVIDVYNTTSISTSQLYRIAADVNSTNNEQYTGHIYSIRVYNRPLTPTEVMQNYQATRGRYGV